MGRLEWGFFNLYSNAHEPIKLNYFCGLENLLKIFLKKYPKEGITLGLS